MVFKRGRAGVGATVVSYFVCLVEYPLVPLEFRRSRTVVSVVYTTPIVENGLSDDNEQLVLSEMRVLYCETSVIDETTVDDNRRRSRESNSKSRLVVSRNRSYRKYTFIWDAPLHESQSCRIICLSTLAKTISCFVCDR